MKIQIEIEPGAHIGELVRILRSADYYESGLRTVIFNVDGDAIASVTPPRRELTLGQFQVVGHAVLKAQSIREAGNEPEAKALENVIDAWSCGIEGNVPDLMKVSE